MKKSLVLIAIAIFVLALVGCAQPANPGSTSSPATSSSSTGQAAPVATSVWDTTISSGAYKSWPTAPGYETTQVARGPHGKSVQVYVDPNMSTTLSGPAATTWPVGGMIVKDAYDANNQLMQIEYMQKTGAGWYFASFMPDGKVAVEGVKVDPCNACHTKNSSDGVKSFKLPQ